MTNYPIGFHFGPGGTRTGIAEYLDELNSRRLGGFVKSVDDYGICGAVAIRNRGGQRHNIVFRMKAKGDAMGVDLDVPDYSLSPKEAALKHWGSTMQLLPPEFHKDQVWLEIINEVDKNRAEWLAQFASESYALSRAADIRLAMFGWSAGEPEKAHWEGPHMRHFLEQCAADPQYLAIALHEYALNEDLLHHSPYMVGRFSYLLQACDKYGIGHPTILITEFGWNATYVPDVTSAQRQLKLAERMYAEGGVTGAAIWYFGAGWGGIHKVAAPLIPAVTENAKTFTAPNPPPPPPPVDPPPPPPPPASGNLLENHSFEGGTYKWNGVNEINCPIRWDFWHATENKPPNSFDPAAHSQYRQPEVVVLHKNNLPPNERDLFVLDGSKTLHVFKGHGSLYFKLSQDLSLPPGKYRFTVPIFPDVVKGYKPSGEKIWADDPRGNDCVVVLSGALSISQEFRLKPGKWHSVEYNFEVIDDSPSEVVISVYLPFPVPTNGVFIDNCKVVAVGAIDPPPPPPTEEPPMVDYVVKAHLLPQSATGSEASLVMNTALPEKQSVVFSADDAARLVAPGLPGSAVFVWWPERWGGQKAIGDWMNERGVETVIFKPDNALAGLKLGNLFQVDYIQTGEFNDPRAYGPHEGADYDVRGWEPNSREPVLAMAPGRVTYAGWDSNGYGNLVTVESSHNGILYRIWYAHLDVVFASAGLVLRAGDAIGEVGNTGNTDGEHVHITMQVPGYGLSGYSVSDVIDPAPYIPAYTPPSLKPPALLGLHASADPDLAAGEIDMFVRAKASAVKVMTSHSPTQLAQLKAALPGALWIVRVFLSHGNRVVSPSDFVSWTLGDLKRTLDIVGHDAYVEVHNEPNLADEGMWKSWQNGKQFGEFFMQVWTQYRAILPAANLKCVFPGLSPGGNVPGIRYDSNVFSEEARSAINAASGLGVHAYWAHNWPMQKAVEELQQWSNRFPSQKVILVTEASNNKGGTAAATKAAQYIEFAKQAGQVDGVKAVTYFVASASNPAWQWPDGSCETWLGTVIPAAVGARAL